MTFYCSSELISFKKLHFRVVAAKLILQESYIVQNRSKGYSSEFTRILRLELRLEEMLTQHVLTRASTHKRLEVYDEQDTRDSIETIIHTPTPL